MADIESVQVGTDGSGDYQTIADVTARENIRNLEKVTITPLQDHPHLATNDTINQAFSKTEAWFNSLGQMAFKDNLTKSDVTSALDYDPQAADNDIRQSFQAGVNAVYDAVDDKGVTPASKSLEDIVTAIGQIETGGNYDTLDVSFGPTGTIYNAEDYPGIDAWNIVRVVPPQAPFTVKFFDDDHQTVIKTDATVPYGGSASCTLLDGTVVGGEYFKGWNPSPVNVKENMNCYPIRGEYVLDPNEIQDSWETICADGGAHYPLGSYKALVLDVDVAQGDVITEYQDSYNGVLVPYRIISAENRVEALRIAFHMVKVAEGEDGSRSTWLSTGCPIFTSSYMNFIYQRWDEDNQEWVQTATQSMSLVLAALWCHDIGSTHPMRDWSTAWIRGFLKNMIYNKLPNVLKDTIKTVTKHTYGYSTMYSDASRVEKETLDELWIPSMKELETLFSSYTLYNADCYPSAFNDVIEHNGIDYSSVYVPTYPTAGAPVAFVTRTMVSHISTGVISMWLCGNSANNQYGSWQRFGGNTGWFPIGFCL